MAATTHTKPSPNVLRRQGKGRRRVQVAGWTMTWLGVLILGFLAFQLWGTGLSTAAAQDRLDQQLTERVAATPIPTSPTVTVPANAVEQPDLLPTSTPSAPELIPEEPPAVGDALGWIRIPEADVDHVMVSGVTREVLKLGPGHMPWTPLPGQPGNAVVSGHRTTYGAPFFNLDRVEVSDEIYVETTIGTHTYRVREILVVDPTDVWVTDPRPGAWLTLTTCTPRYSAAQRLVITAEMVDGPNVRVVEAASTSTAAEPR